MKAILSPKRARPTRAGRPVLRYFLGGLLTAACVLPALAADWPQWRGPRRNGVSAEKGWSHQWRGGPRQLWSASVGQGYSSVAVWGGRVYTIGNANNQDTVYCLDSGSGRVSWRHSYRCAAGDYGGPRSTPVVDAGKVYTLSREGQAYCLNATTGKVVWAKDLRRETNAQVPRWGFAGSPLIAGNVAIYNVGTAGVGVDKNTGRVVWRSGNGAAGYASPVAYNVGGKPGVALFTAFGLVGLDPATGRQFFRFPWETIYEVNAADPIQIGDSLFISSNYGKGAALVRISGARPTVVWQNRNMRNHVNSCVFVNGHLFGNDENTLKCIDARTGAERWRSRGIGKGGLIAADGKLIVLTERGELTVVSATPNGYQELARAKVLNGTCWTHPVLANGRIYCRNHEGQLVCLNAK